MTSATHGLRIGARPTTPSTLHLDAVAREAERLAGAAPPISSPHVGAPPELRAALAAAVDDLASALGGLSAHLFALAEPGFAEVKSAAAIVETLEARGLRSELDVYGLPTAFVAELPAAPAASGAPDASDASGPTIALLAEYDALPGVGHACGHNLIAAASVGAFLALAEARRQNPASVPGRVLLIGTPAEEGGNGKELLARAGAFDDVDIAVMAHPFGADLADPVFIGRRIVRIVYHGVAAHAAAAPFQGRNALDAAALNYQAVGLLRQHLPPGDRIHGVFVDGGARPNVVPERAELEYYVRSHEISTLRELSARVDDIANGIALATGTGVEVTWDPQPFSLPIRHNGPLAERWALAQAERGRRVLRAADAPGAQAASTDFGNISQRVPGIHPVIAIAPPEIALHTREFAEYAGSPTSIESVTDAAYGLAATVADALLDADLLAAVRDDFAAAGGPVDVERTFA
ncbi:M20 family metallopeptidase [Agromyces allii]|uniref:M20 family metallopeptidase n=1 Tax=Agromyces allii TaxID=393607 RepID=A0ABN2R908_9MICO|nr:M20 family metallopeptidase [Agromyces allii]